MRITLQGLNKSYQSNGNTFAALKDVSFSVAAGELVYVTGKSGSGKSTLLNMVAGLDRPSSGQINVAGHDLHLLDQDSLAKIRGESIGVVFQFFQLLPTLTAMENVMLAMDFVNKVPRPERGKRALDLLDRFGVRDQADKLPSALSGGQMQRAAIARALANDPPVVVADEPTGNLDSATASQVMAHLAALAEAGKTVLVVTHDPENGVAPSRVISLADGRMR